MCIKNHRDDWGVGRFTVSLEGVPIRFWRWLEALATPDNNQQPSSAQGVGGSGCRPDTNDRSASLTLEPSAVPSTRPPRRLSFARSLANLGQRWLLALLFWNGPGEERGSPSFFLFLDLCLTTFLCLLAVWCLPMDFYSCPASRFFFFLAEELAGIIYSIIPESGTFG